MRMGAMYGRQIAQLHLTPHLHLGELNRIRKRLRDKDTAAIILEGFYSNLGLTDRWRPVMVRAFQRSALGLMTTAMREEVF